MKRLWLAALLGASALTCSGCLVVSLEPLYDGTTIEVDERLLGTWENTEQQVTIVVEHGEWRAYKLTYTDRSGAMSLLGYGTRIGDAWFLDVTPAKGLDSGPLMIPAHLACRVQLGGDRFTVEALDYDWFIRPGEGRSPRPAHTFDSRKNVVLTATRAALRAWVLALPGPAEAFSEPMTFVRRKG